jgi:hypothetical protein
MPIPLPQRIIAARYVAPPRPYLPNEQETLVGQIGLEIAHTAGFAKTGKGPGVLGLKIKATRDRPEHYRLETTMRGTEPQVMELGLSNYLWDPNNYTALARQILGLRAGATPLPHSGADPEMFQRLARPTGELFIREDKRLSQALTEHPLDAELHEQAALLIGSFALRHAAACFYDIRRELCAITAHLAIARALDENAGPAGQLAEAILSTLSGRQSAALEILQELDRHRDSNTGLPMEANTIWNRSLTLRNTGDYRKLDQPEHASLLERLEYVRALHFRVSSEAATKFLLDYPAERMAEWTNIALTGGFSVEEGNRWSGKALVEELEETMVHYRAYHDSRLDPNDAAAVTAALNTPANQINETNAASPRMEVLGWGMWAQLHQRQLCELLDAGFNFLDQQVGLPEAARKFREEVTKRFSGLDLFPLVGMGSERDPGNVEENDRRTAKLWQEKPQLVPFAFSIGQKSRLTHATANLPPSVLPPQAWFQPPFPFGTVYDATNREMSLPTMDEPQLAQLKALAPFNNRILYHHLTRKWTSRAAPKVIATQFEALTGYDTWAMEVVANGVASDPDRYEAIFARLCELNPNQYLQLGKYLREHGRPEAAARAYQKAVDLAHDRVWVSNNMDWLVNYYYSHDRKADAFAVAEMAADVYSSGGLETMALLCERADRLIDAENYFRKLSERYERWGELLGFYTRHRSEPKYAAAADRLSAKVFPDGREEVNVAALSGVPATGLVLTSSSKTCAGLGLVPGDVIVAINGVRVQNESQYFYQMDTAPSEKVDLIVWSHPTYRTIAAILPNHRLGATIATFRPPDARKAGH